MPDNTLKNTVLLQGPLTYVLRDNDDIVNVDTTVGPVTLVLANIYNNGLMFNQKTYYINDVGGQASVNNVIVTTTGTDLINGGPSASIIVNGGSGVVQISGQAEWLMTGDFAGSSTSVTDFKNMLVVDEVYGNDATAVPYDQLKPYQSVSKAIDNAKPGDLIYINPNAPFSIYFVPLGIFVNSLGDYNGLNFFISKGATVYFGASDRATGTENVSVFGEGDVVFYSYIYQHGDYSGTVTIDCTNVSFFGTVYYAETYSGEMIINAKQKLTLYSYFYLQNDGFWAIATRPTKFTCSASVLESNSGIITIIYGPQVQINLNFNNYTTNIIYYTKDIWCTGTTPPTFPVISYINIGNYKDDRQFAGSVNSSIFFYQGSSFNQTFITGNYTKIGNGVAVQLPALIEIGDCNFGLISFNGVANITKGSMFVDLNSPTANVKIAGQVKVDNSTVAFQEYLFSAYFVSLCKLVIEADTFINSPLNHGVQLGKYTILGTSAEVDINDCQIVNADVSGGPTPATIIKGLDAFFGPMTIAYGVLRLKNAKIMGPITTIQGSTLNEPVQVYSAYVNKPVLSIANEITGTNIIEDILITSNNF